MQRIEYPCEKENGAGNHGTEKIAGWPASAFIVYCSMKAFNLFNPSLISEVSMPE